MPGRAFTAISVLFAICASLAIAQSAPPPLDIPGGARSGRVVVTLKKSAYQRLVNIAGANPAAVIADPRAFLDTGFKMAAARWSVSAMRPLYERPFLDPALAAQLGLDRVYILNAPHGADPQAMSASFAQSADIESAFTDTIGGVAVVPNDPAFPLQYALDNSGQVAGGTVDADIDAVEAWSIHTGDAGTVTIAILDSGVNPHSEFDSRLIAGRNTADPGNPTLTSDGCLTINGIPHGTHVAGIAAASGDNAIGIAGVTWGANIMPVRVLAGCNGVVSALAAGIVWAADNGADVINMSLQYYNLSQAEILNLQNAVNYAHGLQIVLVAAAGNNNQGGVGVIAFPARLANVLAVTATTGSDAFASFSNQGPQVDLCAPGKDIHSISVGADNYGNESGTSMACPHVAGAAALLWSYEPALSRDHVIDLLRFTTDDLGAPGWDQQFGQGRLNAWKALSTVPCFTDSLAEPAPEAEIYHKNRAISFQPANLGQSTALRVRLVSIHHPSPPYTGGTAISYAALEGQFRWVGPHSQYIESASSQIPFTAANLQCSPHFADWGTVGLLHVFGAEVVPSSTYEIQSVSEGCPIASSFVYSPALPVQTGRWGDVSTPFNPPANSAQPDLADISALVSKFRSVPTAPIKARSLLAGTVPDPTNDLDFSHISACVDAFRGQGYPYQPPPNCSP